MFLVVQWLRQDLRNQELFLLIIKGVAISGAFFYNHKDAQNQVAVSTEGETFDTCMGHADPMCR